MSYERARKAINLDVPDMIPQIESLAHEKYIKWLTSLDAIDSVWHGLSVIYRELDLDLIVYTEEGCIPIWEEEHKRVTNWGKDVTEWQTKFRFKTVEEVLAYDPWNDQIAKTDDEIKRQFGRHRHDILALFGDAALVSGGLYRTLFMWPVLTFGWELFLTAAASEPRKFKVILDKFAEISVRDTKAWAQTEIELFASHDDLAMTAGPIFNPQWYRDYIFPLYKEIWKPLKEKGIKILFISDGDITTLIDDLVEAGADGFMIEPFVDLKWLTTKYGKDKIIIGNIDTRILTFGDSRGIKKEVERCATTGVKCPGYFFKASGGIPNNIPLTNVKTYFKATQEWRGLRQNTKSSRVGIHHS